MFNYSSLTSVAACNDYLELKTAELGALSVRLSSLQQRLQSNLGPEGSSNLAQELADASATVASFAQSLLTQPEGALRRRTELMLEDAQKALVKVEHKIQTLGIHGVLDMEVEVHEMAQRLVVREVVIASITAHRETLPPDAVEAAA